MSDTPQTQPPGWYYAQGDPPGTQRYWDGTAWQGGPQPVPGVNPAGDGALSATNQADPGMRILARIIDGVIWVILMTVASLPFGLGSAVSGDNIGLSVGASLLGSLVGYVLVVAYEVVMIGTQGATVGKLALGMKVVNADGSPTDMNTGVRRNYLLGAWCLIGLVPILGFLGFWILAIVGLVLMFTDAANQTPWDKVGKTLVVKR